MGQKLRRRKGLYARCKQSRDITKIKQMKSPTINACQITLGFYTICKASHHSVNNEFGPIRKCFVAYCTYFTTSLIFILYILAGLPRARSARGTEPPWNMVNLFSFGCHVIDRAYVRTRLQIVRVG